MIVQANPGFWVVTENKTHPVIAWLIEAWDDGTINKPIPITPTGVWKSGPYKLECPYHSDNVKIANKENV